MSQNCLQRVNSEKGQGTGTRKGRILMIGKLMGFLLFAVLLSSCSRTLGAERNAVIKGQDLSADFLVGEWDQFDSDSGVSRTITLNSDGTGKLTEDIRGKTEYEIEWSFQDGELEAIVNHTVHFSVCYYFNGKLYLYRSGDRAVLIKKDQKEPRTHTVSEEERKILGSWQWEGEGKEPHGVYTFFEDGMYSLKRWGNDPAKVNYYEPCDWFVIDNCLVLQTNPTNCIYGGFTWTEFAIDSITSHHISIKIGQYTLTMTRID